MKKTKIIMMCSLITSPLLLIIPLMSFRTNTTSKDIEKYVNSNVGTYDKNKLKEETFEITNSLPDKWDPREKDENGYTKTGPIKHQGNSPLCWAYSLASLAEDNLYKNKLFSGENPWAEKNKVNPYNISYASMNRNASVDKLGLTWNHTNEVGRDDGYWAIVGALRMSQWTSPTAGRDTYVNARQFGEPIAHLNEVITFPNESFVNIQTLKEVIYKYGGVAFSYSASFATGKYVTISRIMNSHESIIVGWDDSVPRDKFTKYGKTPSQDGAWIIKNSWGEGYNNNGYIYASYDSYIKNPVAINFTDKTPYKNSNYYYYDSGDGLRHLGSAYIHEATEQNQYAAVFPVLKDSYNSKEILKEVVFEIGSRNQKIKVDIYKDVKDVNLTFPKSKENNPISGTLVHSQIATYEYPGMHFLKLKDKNGNDKKIELERGQNFSVVITVLEGETINGRKPSILSSVEKKSVNDMTFFKNSNGEWTNFLSYSNNAARIRAITDSIPKEDKSIGGQIELKYANIKFDKYALPFDGKTKNFDVYMNDRKLSEGSDYEIKSKEYRMGKRDIDFSSSKANEVVGAYVVTLEGRGQYSGALVGQTLITKSDFPQFPANVQLESNNSKVIVDVPKDATKFSDVSLGNDWEWTYPNNNIDDANQNYIKWKHEQENDYYTRTMFPVKLNRNSSTTTTKPITSKEEKPTVVTPKPNPIPTPQPTIPKVPEVKDDTKNISSLDIQIEAIDYIYNGKEIKPIVTVKDGETKLSENIDYEVSYSNNVNIGQGMIYIKGKNKYTGIETKTFTIGRATSNQISNFKIDENNKPQATATFGEVKFKFSPKEDFSEAILFNSYPSSKGTWYVKAYVDENDNYPKAESSETLSFTNSSDIRSFDDINENLNSNKNVFEKNKTLFIGVIVGAISLIASAFGMLGWWLIRNKKKN